MMGPGFDDGLDDTMRRLEAETAAFLAEMADNDLDAEIAEIIAQSDAAIAELGRSETDRAIDRLLAPNHLPGLASWLAGGRSLDDVSEREFEIFTMAILMVAGKLEDKDE